MGLEEKLTKVEPAFSCCRRAEEWTRPWRPSSRRRERAALLLVAAVRTSAHTRAHSHQHSSMRAGLWATRGWRATQPRRPPYPSRGAVLAAIPSPSAPTREWRSCTSSSSSCPPCASRGPGAGSSTTLSTTARSSSRSAAWTGYTPPTPSSSSTAWAGRECSSSHTRTASNCSWPVGLGPSPCTAPSARSTARPDSAGCPPRGRASYPSSQTPAAPPPARARAATGRSPCRARRCRPTSTCSASARATQRRCMPT